MSTILRWCPCNITNFSVFRNKDINLAKVGDGDVVRAPQLNDHDTFAFQARTVLATFSGETTSTRPDAFVENNTAVLHMAFCINWRTKIIF